MYVSGWQSIRTPDVFPKRSLRKSYWVSTRTKKLSFDKYESYYAQPTFVSSDKYYVHCDINAYSEFDFTDAGKITLYFQEPPVIITDSGQDFAEVARKLTGLLGRQKALPDWLYDGVILGIQEGTDVVDAKIKKAKEAGVPVVGVWCQDWSGCRRTGFGYQVMWNWEWDQELYPGLDKKIAEGKEEGVRFLGYINHSLPLKRTYMHMHLSTVIVSRIARAKIIW